MGLLRAFFFFWGGVVFGLESCCLFVGFVVGRNIGWWMIGCWFCDGGEMAEEEGVLE